mmetsp:Transcript_8010/g.13316  ORF Transcript_8010/g.13316 Transcript_8010/m.13316 type:complete len:166 (+) Transcript_8010:37-534(+)
MGPKKAAHAHEELPAEPTFGSGEFQLPDSSTYVGEFSDLNGVKTRHGKGVFTFGEEIYTGDWADDAMNGDGEIKFASGSSYSGQFMNNMFHGDGIYIFPDGACYKGQWQRNKMHGTGIYTGSDGIVTEGEFRNGYYYTGEKIVPVRPNLSSAAAVAEDVSAVEQT